MLGVENIKKRRISVCFGGVWNRERWIAKCSDGGGCGMGSISRRGRVFFIGGLFNLCFKE